MKYKIECSFKIESSHSINQPGFFGENKMELICPFEVNNCFGQAMTIATVTQRQGSTYTLIVVTESLLEKNEQKQFVGRFAELITFILNKSEPNPAYGNHVVKINWVDYFAVQISEEPNSVTARAMCSGTSRGKTDLKIYTAFQNRYHEILEFYFDGLRAEHEKAKFFHWYLVIEYIEHSSRYRERFVKAPLFSGQDLVKLEDFSGYFSNESMKASILSLKNKSALKKEDMILTFLNEIGVTTISNLQSRALLTSKHIKRLIEVRNKLVHKNSAIPEDILWTVLFPLVTKIVELLIHNPDCLSSN